MTTFINFNELEEKVNSYGGSERKKKFYDSNTKSTYLVKLPDPIREKNNSLSYMNNQFSEYVGSHIYELIGVPVQETIMGVVTDNKRRIVVGCKDFTTSNTRLIEFGTYELSRNPDLIFEQSVERFMSTVDNDMRFNQKQAKKMFWDMFLVDALIMNGDRHFHNIGVLEDLDSGILSISPVYDCGSCLGALMSDELLSELLSDQATFKGEVYNTHSSLSFDGKRILNHQFILNANEGLANSIRDIAPKIDLLKINKMIDETPFLSDIRKEFYKNVIKFNKENMLDVAYKKLLKNDKLKDIDDMMNGKYNPDNDNNDKGYEM